MQPKLILLTDELLLRIIDETFVARIPEQIVKIGLSTVPRKFYLYDYEGNPKVEYGGDTVQFDPGSSGIAILDPETFEHKTTETRDLIKLIKVAEQLLQYDAQSTAVVCHDVPKDLHVLYRLYLVMLYSKKPIVTGAFTNNTVHHMINMLAIFAGGKEALRAKPRAVFDVCPSPPLIWSNFGAGNLITLARAGVPAEIVSMPLAGAAAPVPVVGA